MARPRKLKPAETPFTGNLEELIIQSLLEKKAEDLIQIDLKSMDHVLFDSFIICTGNSKPHVETLAEFLVANVKQATRMRPTVLEGTNNGEWILLDYFNIIVHIFQPEAREFYNIEKLWSDAPIQRF